MATTTPNYGWDVPTSTDYVADGAVAIETLGDDIDASLFSITGGKNVGMVHINTTSFTNSTALTISNIFTSAFNTYKVVLEIDSCSSGGGADIYFQLTAAGVASTTNYSNAYIIRTGSSFATGNLTVWGAAYAASGQTTQQASFEMSYVAQTKVSTYQGNSIRSDESLQIWGGRHTLANAYDGLKLISPQITGNVRVYGMRNS
jgi:hypothetical protein